MSAPGTTSLIAPFGGSWCYSVANTITGPSLWTAVSWVNPVWTATIWNGNVAADATKKGTLTPTATNVTLPLQTGGRWWVVFTAPGGNQMDLQVT